MDSSFGGRADGYAIGHFPRVGRKSGHPVCWPRRGGAVRGAPDDWRILFNKTYAPGGSRAAMNHEPQAHSPLLLHDEPRHVAVLGVATGRTRSGVVLHPDVERIEAVELSPLALEIVTRQFAPFNRGAFREPRGRPMVGEGSDRTVRYGQGRVGSLQSDRLCLLDFLVQGRRRSLVVPSQQDDSLTPRLVQESASQSLSSQPHGFGLGRVFEMALY